MTLSYIPADTNDEGILKATASGVLPNGKPVIVNADGTVSVVSGEDTGLGSDTAFNQSGNSSFVSSTYDSTNNKIVVVEGDSSNSQAFVGTVSGSTITFGAGATVDSSETEVFNVVFDTSNNKIVVAYRDGGDGDKVKARVGTVSGTSISFGSIVVVANQGSDGNMTFDSNANKVLITYTYGSAAYAVVGTVSGTSISFGSIATSVSGQAPTIGQAFDSNANKHLIAYGEGNALNFGSKVATISGTSVSFGSAVSIGQLPQNNVGTAVFDPDNNKVVVFYADRANSGYGSARVGTISGTSISYGTAVVFASSTPQYIGASYDTANNKIVMAYQLAGGVNRVQTATVSGTSITFADDAIAITSTTIAHFDNGLTYDPDQGKTVIAYRDDGQGSDGYAKVYTVGSTNLTSENYIGISTGGTYASGSNATVKIIGNTSDEQSGLTAGQAYYVQTDGTIGTTPADPSVFAGTAISATKMLVKT
jgi:hypothetical protein